MKGVSTCLLGLTGILVLSGCGSPGDAHHAGSRVARDAVVVDVRTPGEYARNHLAGTTNIPVDEVAHRIEQVVPDKNTPIVLHCQTGARSATAKELLEAKGYKVQDLGSFANAKSALQSR